MPWNISRRALVAGSATLISASMFRAGVAQESWPVRPIRVISAGSPGGSSDIFVRILENRLRERLGQSIILENRPGAGGMLAAGFASNANDGHTFFVSTLRRTRSAYRCTRIFLSIQRPIYRLSLACVR
jgi:tripartite-type tricarboxylate transporter receptor subunit TctC